jgi:hypothetical protein
MSVLLKITLPYSSHTPKQKQDILLLQRCNTLRHAIANINYVKVGTISETFNYASQAFMVLE